MNLNMVRAGFAALCVSLLSMNVAQAASEVSIEINGTISKFVHIVTDMTNANVDLESIYDQDTGALMLGHFPIAAISSFSNSADGYSIAVETQNGFAMQNMNGAGFMYRLMLNGAEKFPDNGVAASVGFNGEVIMDVPGGNTFFGNSMILANLILETQETGDFSFRDGNFSDTATLVIAAK